MDTKKFSNSRHVDNQIWMESTGPEDRVELGESGQTISSSWFRGGVTNFMPNKDELIGDDAAYKYILKGWLPSNPAISAETKITAFGSCFAANITNWLNSRNYTVLTGDKTKNAYVVQCGDGMVTTFTIRQQFEWALENKTFSQSLWHAKDKRAVAYDEDVRQTTRALFLDNDLVIITLGLSEVWYDEKTREVFWRAIPKSEYDPSRHGFRVSTVQENKENLQAIFDLIKCHKPDATVLFTLSPVPLAATFRPVSCITANSVSKAILRAALDEFLRENDRNFGKDLFYWPSYELVTELFTDSWTNDRRHIRKEVLDFIMTLFESHWCAGSELERSVTETWAEARFATGALPRRFKRLVLAGDRKHALELLRAHQKAAPQEARLMVRWASEWGSRQGVGVSEWFEESGLA